MFLSRVCNVGNLSLYTDRVGRENEGNRTYLTHITPYPILNAGFPGRNVSGGSPGSPSSSFRRREAANLGDLIRIRLKAGSFLPLLRFCGTPFNSGQNCGI
jgi:hypothetical protein